MDCKICIIIALCCLIPFLVAIMLCVCSCCDSGKKCICRNMLGLGFILSLCTGVLIWIASKISEFIMSIAGDHLNNLLNIEHKKSITLITNDERVAYWVIFITALITLIVVFVLIIKHVVFLIEIILVQTKISIHSRWKKGNDTDDYVIKESSQLIEKLRRHNLPDIFKNSLKDIYEQ